MLEDLNLNNTEGGILIFTEIIGFVISTYYSGILSSKLGVKNLYFLMLIILVVGMIVYGLSINFGLVLVGAFIFGFGLGGFHLAANAFVGTGDSKTKAKRFNRLHIFFGLGALFSPIYVNFIYKIGLTWNYVFLSAVIVPVILLILTNLWFNKLPDSVSVGKLEKGLSVKLLKDKYFFLICLGMFIYLGMDVGIISWLTGFLNKVKGLDFETSGYYFFFWFFGIMFGRFLGSLLSKYLNELTLSILISISIIFMCFGIFASPSFAFSFGIIALCFSVTYPTFCALTAKHLPEYQAPALGILITAGGFGSAIFPLTMGILNDVIGKDLGMTQSIFLGLVLIAILLLLFRKTRSYY